MTQVKKRLGKGLDSLLSSTRLEQISRSALAQPDMPPRAVAESVPGTDEPAPDAVGPGREVIEQLPVDSILRNPHQPRQHWDEEKLIDLAESIKVNGLIQPIVVRPMGDKFQLIAGERRLKAMQVAGKPNIPAIVRHATEEQVLEWALVENIHRTDLNPIERARAYQNYLSTFSLTQQQAAQRLGEDRSTIANYVRLLELDGQLQQMVADERLTMGHARALLGLADLGQREILAQETTRDRLSVRDVERRVRNMEQDVRAAIRRNPIKSAHILDLEQQMTRKLGTKVTIQTVGRRAQRGRIIIEFYNLEDFDHISEKLQT